MFDCIRLISVTYKNYMTLNVARQTQISTFAHSKWGLKVLAHEEELIVIDGINIKFLRMHIRNHFKLSNCASKSKANQDLLEAYTSRR